MSNIPFTTPSIARPEDILSKQHGTYEIFQFDNCIVVWAEGPWNIEAVQNYHKELLTIVQAMNGQSWYYVSIVKGEAVFPPEASILFDIICKELATLKLQKCAFLVNDSFAPIFTENHFKQFYENNGIQFNGYTVPQDFENELLTFSETISLKDLLHAPDWW